MTAPHGLVGKQVAGEEVARPASAAEQHARKCPTCHQHFSGGDARFCPFDGDPLGLAPSYRPEADPLLGRLVDGRYEVESVLGEGGMGSVYKVRHQALDKQFAMKVMRADLARQGELAARFIQEARATAAIGHPNIVQITDFGRLPSAAPYFVMELLDGMPLSQLIRAGGPLPAGFAVRTLQQTASALAAAHEVGVIHRDLKPDNIHITESDAVKVLDFGVAKMAGAGRLTRTGMVFGTPHYMSPEQASGEEVDHRADIYALGIIMYEMFTGKVPFEADSYMGVLTKHMFMVPEPPSLVHAAARELGALEDVTLRCLEKKPEARYASMNELIGHIESIVHFSGDKLEIARRPSHFERMPSTRALADELEPPARDELRRSLRPAGVSTALLQGVPPTALALGTLAGAIVLGGIVYALVRSPDPPDSSQGSASAPVMPVASAPTLEPPPLEPPILEAPPLERPPVELAPADPEPPASQTRVGAASPSEKPAVSAAVRSKHPAPKPPAKAVSQPTPSHSPFAPGDIVNPWAR